MCQLLLRLIQLHLQFDRIRAGGFGREQGEDDEEIRWDEKIAPILTNLPRLLREGVAVVDKRSARFCSAPPIDRLLGVKSEKEKRMIEFRRCTRIPSCQHHSPACEDDRDNGVLGTYPPSAAGLAELTSVDSSRSARLRKTEEDTPRSWPDPPTLPAPPPVPAAPAAPAASRVRASCCSMSASRERKLATWLSRSASRSSSSRLTAIARSFCACRTCCCWSRSEVRAAKCSRSLSFCNWRNLANSSRIDASFSLTSAASRSYRLVTSAFCSSKSPHAAWRSRSCPSRCCKVSRRVSTWRKK